MCTAGILRALEQPPAPARCTPDLHCGLLCIGSFNSVLSARDRSRPFRRTERSGRPCMILELQCWLKLSVQQVALGCFVASSMDCGVNASH
jgi:hypothetical protein